MKRTIGFIATIFLFINVHSQERPLVRIPDIPGYETLLCDFHLHTVFSDGNVWPTIRVNEAIREGLDAIAITDHLEYLPHKRDIRTDHNRSWEIAADYAEGKGLIVIPGTEITKGMPPGHFNALFIQDAAPILNEDYSLAIETAAGQGAFITWNHPGWKAQQPDTMKWWDEHTYLYEQGWLHGIEVVNNGEFYPGAVDWALEKGLTMLGNSDQHAPFLFTEFDPDHHRPMTLVFAPERTPGGIREALFNGRTAVFNGRNLIGKPSVLEALFLQSVSLKVADPEMKKYVLVNPTDLYFEIILENKVTGKTEEKILLKPAYASAFELAPESGPEQINVRVKNCIVGSDACLIVKLGNLRIESGQ